jgi:urea transport system permease protein
MYLKLEASGSQLPDFMFWSGLKELPFFWQPFHSPVLAITVAIVLPFLLAALLGYMVFRSRIQGVYFSIITQALTLLVSILFIGQQPITGGTNGITNLSTIFGHSLASQDTQTVLYLITALCLAGAFVFTRWLTQSRYGRLLVAIRDNESRVRFLGHNPITIKVLAFAISAGLAGLAGALFVPQVGIISPSAMAVVPSIEMVVWVALGGRGTLIGAIIGTLLVTYGKSAFSESYPDIWQYFLGALFIGSVILFPSGVVGAAKRWLRRIFPGPSQTSE